MPPSSTYLPDWVALQHKAHALLRDTQHAQFLSRLEQLYQELHGRVQHSPDATLFALIHLSATEMRSYSATHAMLVYVLCSLAASETLNWSPERDAILGKAALTMNISMSALQDDLVLQTKPLSVAQMEAVEQHAERSCTMLRSMGVKDEDWLLAVRHHHDRLPGPPASDALHIARLIQRADIYAARLSPRLGRLCLPPGAAGQSDEASDALVQTMGLYAPGTLVRLASQEIAAVIRRGIYNTTPQVAVLINRQGMPTGEWIVRDTQQSSYKITGHVARRDVRTAVPMEQLLELI
jgi:HD-GYP domain-containing protein (c-di-GMP phosphodiesterase class II)